MQPDDVFVSSCNNIQHLIRKCKWKFMRLWKKIFVDLCMKSKKQLHKIRDAIYYSDPMTNDYVAQVDQMIRDKVTELKYFCQSDNKNEALQTCFKLKAYIDERNAKLLISK